MFMFYNDEFYEITNLDMAEAELDSEFGVIVLDKKLFSFKRKKRFNLKLIVENGEMKKIVIRAPYGFIVKLFKTFNYKPLICNDNSFENKHGKCYRYTFTEEWYNPHYSGDDSNQTLSIFDDFDELPF